MLKLSRKADYGLISLKHMAMKNSSASAREIAETYGIPLPLLAKVLAEIGSDRLSPVGEWRERRIQTAHAEPARSLRSK